MGKRESRMSESGSKILAEEGREENRKLKVRAQNIVFGVIAVLLILSAFLVKSGPFVLFVCILPMVQLILIKWLDISRILWILTIVTAFLAILATAMEVSFKLNKTPGVDGGGLIYFYLIFFGNLIVFLIKKYHLKLKKQKT